MGGEAAANRHRAAAHTPHIDESLWPSVRRVARQIGKLSHHSIRFNFRALPSLPNDGCQGVRLETSLPGRRLFDVIPPTTWLMANSQENSWRPGRWRGSR